MLLFYSILDIIKVKIEIYFKGDNMKDNYEYLINVISNKNPNISIVEKDNKLVLIQPQLFIKPFIN